MARPLTVTAQGGAKITTADKVFGTGALILDGIKSYVKVNDDAVLDFTGDCTIEARVKFISVIPGPSYICVRNNGANSSGFGLWYFSSGYLAFYATGIGEYVYWTASTDTWYDICISISGTSLRFFVNGTQVGETKTISAPNVSLSTPLSIGCFIEVGNTPNTFANYKMDELRISKTARHTANYTVSSVPFTSDADTILLVHFDGPNNSTTLVDDDKTVKPNAFFNAF